jgi:hypothetical protein
VAFARAISACSHRAIVLAAVSCWSFWDRVQVRNADYWVAPHNNWLYSASADAMYPSGFLLRGNRWSYVHNLCRETCCQPD